MRMVTKAIFLASALVLAAAPLALADPPPASGCATPGPVSGNFANADYNGICTPAGSLVVGQGGTGAYIYADGADQNPAVLGGYAVVGVNTQNQSVFCQTSGNPGGWAGNYAGPQACVA